MTPEELQQAKDNPVEPHVFKQLPNEQKYILIEYYLKNLKLSKEQVAEIMGGINPKSVASTKTRFKKDYDKLSDHEKAVLNGEIVGDNQAEENEIQEQHDEDDLFLIGNTLKNQNNKREDEQVEEDNKEDEVEEVQKSETLPKPPQANEAYGLQLMLPSGEYDGIDVKQKLEGLKVLVNEDKEYTVEIVLKEKK